ncbi:hypothetical protein KAR28_02450 [Candidatus Parcubacteria bacterium]|nr:hypothetical protein [Candidatus Parcubacteria bacterium]
MAEKKLNCPMCLRYASDGDTEHHRFCPTIADDPEQASKDHQQGFNDYCRCIKRNNISAENEKNPYYMVGYNTAFLVDDQVESFLSIEKLYTNKEVDAREM